MAEVCNLVTGLENKGRFVVGVQGVGLVVKSAVGIDEGLVIFFVGNQMK